MAEILVDCRVPPGMDGARGPRARPRRFWAMAADGRSRSSSRSPCVGQPLAAATRRWPRRSRSGSREVDPAAILVPIVMAGFSDSHWFRRAFDSATVYGFCPQREFVAARGGAAGPQRRRARRRRRHRVRGALLSRHRPGGCWSEPIGEWRLRRARRRRARQRRPGPEPPLRLGGMALRNGLLIHGPTAWAAAARAADGDASRSRQAPSRPSRAGRSVRCRCCAGRCGWRRRSR